MTDAAPRLGPEFFARPTTLVAVELISATLWRRSGEGLTAGRIVETEAYLDARDEASHAAWTKRGQEVMQRSPGTIYIYRSYGIHWMFNLVAHEPETAGAILVRAVQPLEGIELMEHRRKTAVLHHLCSGPGKLCQAFDIDEALHQEDVTSSDEIWLTAGTPAGEIDLVMSERIGITRSAELPLRFFEAGNRFVSGHRRGVPFSPEMLPST